MKGLGLRLQDLETKTMQGSDSKFRYCLVGKPELYPGDILRSS